MNFDDISKMLYTEWFFPLLLTYLSCGMTYLVYRSFHLYNAKAVKLFALTILAGLIVFYFVIPVPVKIQDSFVQFEQAFNRENDGYNGVYTELSKRDVCKNGYLTAFGFFILKNSFRKDQELTFKVQGYLSGAPYEGNTTPYQYICDEK